MHPTQRKLMKRIILFLSLQFPITYPAIAGQDIDLVANVKNGNDSNLLIVFYVQIMPDDFVMQLHRF